MINRRKKDIIFQTLLVVCFLFSMTYLYWETLSQLKERNIASGFAFLNQVAGFDLSESIISYSSTDTYKTVLIAGALNSLKVSFLAMIFSTLWAIVLVSMLRSKFFSLIQLSNGFIHLLKNIPLLLQLFFWYSLFIDYFPTVRQATPFLGIDGFYFTNRGIYFPIFEFSTWTFSSPQLNGFNFSGGMNISPEFSSLLFGLTFYSSTYVATSIQSSLLAVHQGQWEAGRSLGLSDFAILRFIIVPQALRLLIPPYTSQMLSLMKNSSLAVAIAYPDYVSVSNTVINQTGQVIECVFLMMLFYLLLSLITSFILNIYNRKVTYYA